MNENRIVEVKFYLRIVRVMEFIIQTETISWGWYIFADLLPTITKI